MSVVSERRLRITYTVPGYRTAFFIVERGGVRTSLLKLREHGPFLPTRSDSRTKRSPPSIYKDWDAPQCAHAFWICFGARGLRAATRLALGAPLPLLPLLSLCEGLPAARGGDALSDALPLGQTTGSSAWRAGFPRGTARSHSAWLSRSSSSGLRLEWLSLGVPSKKKEAARARRGVGSPLGGAQCSVHPWCHDASPSLIAPHEPST